MFIEPQVLCQAEEAFLHHMGTCHEGYTNCWNFSVGKEASKDVSVQYQWFLGDGQVREGAEVEHCYEQKGDFQIMMIASKQLGRFMLHDTVYQLIRFPSEPKINLHQIPNKARAMYLDASSSYIENTWDVVAYYWCLGDGEFDCGLNIYHEFSSAGQHEIKLLIELQQPEQELKKWICKTLIITLP